MNNKTASNGPGVVIDNLLLFQILDAAEELESRLEEEMGKVGLSGAKASVLYSLGEAKDALTLSELADQNCCVRSNITQLVDRLEADGLVRRVNDPDDRRITRAALTIAGRKAYQDAMGVVTMQEQAVQALLSRDEAGVLARALAKLTG
jgi:DNA-binding MarR family transcriptional regulator